MSVWSTFFVFLFLFLFWKNGYGLLLELFLPSVAAHNYIEEALQLTKKGDHRKAIDLCYKAKQLRPSDPLVYFAWGTCEIGYGRPKEAVDSFKKTIELDSENAKAYVSLGIAYDYLKDKNMAEFYLKKGIEKFQSKGETKEAAKANIVLKEIQKH